jgi:sulfite reductase alpha subunit-like flavoprotein
MLYEDKGVFYLCDPTWPVPDVYETLVTAFEKLDQSQTNRMLSLLGAFRLCGWAVIQKRAPATNGQ